jgi:hypothetical protein
MDPHKAALIDATTDEVLQSDALYERIKPMLAGHAPAVQGATLLQLLALFLAGHAPALREELLDLHISAVLDLIPMMEHDLFGPGGHPARQLTEVENGEESKGPSA